MKTGTSIQTMVAEVSRQHDVKEDFIVPTKKMLVRSDSFAENQYKLALQGVEEAFEMSPHFHRNLGNYLGISPNYYNRLLQSDGLLEDNLNYWFARGDDKRLVRTLDGNARYLASDVYKRIDNFPVIEAMYPVLDRFSNDIVIESCQVTGKKMYLKLVFPRFELDVVKGDPVQFGIIVTNSEVGLGKFELMIFIKRLICLNGMTLQEMIDAGIIHLHRGSRQLEGILSQATNQKELEYIQSEVGDMFEAATNGKLFESIIEPMRAAARSTETTKPEQMVERLTKAFSLSGDESDTVLSNLMTDKDFSKWGALNAVTKVANVTESYDRASDLEKIGGRILSLKDTEWERIAA
ncbi:MAG: DUF932 domain-containing protein [Gammaproteobacteria bacterium]|nr:DUF932 domain-containing protein [Gammaproteobacteria bacterium]